MSEFTAIGEITPMILRQIARKRAEFFQQEAAKHAKRCLISKDPVFLRRYVEASTKADEAVVHWKVKG